MLVWRLVVPEPSFYECFTVGSAGNRECGLRQYLAALQHLPRCHLQENIFTLSALSRLIQYDFGFRVRLAQGFMHGRRVGKSPEGANAFITPGGAVAHVVGLIGM